MSLINEKGLYESTAKNIPEKLRDRLRVSGKDLAIGVDYDRIDATYPTTTTEQYVYSKDTNIILTIEVTYVTSAKKEFLSVEVL